MTASHIAAVSAVVILLILMWLVYRYSLFVPAPRGLPILMYHRVSRQHEDQLTISAARLDSQLDYLKSKGYTAVSFLDVKDSIEGRRPLPSQPVLLTFDDAYRNTYELAAPLLLKHRMKATIFLPVAFIGKWNTWDGGNEPILSYDEIHQLAGGSIEFGLHSYLHENYEHYSAAQAEADLSQCVHTLEDNGCTFTRVFAYPYGRMPSDPAADKALRDSFQRHHINFAVRIGSRINVLPPGDPYQMKRTGINGTDSLREFKIKLRKGRVKLF